MSRIGAQFGTIAPQAFAAYLQARQSLPGIINQQLEALAASKIQSAQAIAALNRQRQEQEQRAYLANQELFANALNSQLNRQAAAAQSDKEAKLRSDLQAQEINARAIESEANRQNELDIANIRAGSTSAHQNPIDALANALQSGQLQKLSDASGISVPELVRGFGGITKSEGAPPTGDDLGFATAYAEVAKQRALLAPNDKRGMEALVNQVRASLAATSDPAVKKKAAEAYAPILGIKSSELLSPAKQPETSKGDAVRQFATTTLANGPAESLRMLLGKLFGGGTPVAPVPASAPASQPFNFQDAVNSLPLYNPAPPILQQFVPPPGYDALRQGPLFYGQPER